MKAAPLLVLTTALSLGGVILLFVQQQELQDKLAGATRSSSSRASAEPDSAMAARVQFLEAELRRLASAVPAGERTAPAASSDGAVAAPADAPAARASEAPAAVDGAATQAELPSAAMDVFRRNVRRAIELNGEDDQGQRVIDQIDRLIERSAIGAMSDSQKTRAAKTVLTAQKKIPELWRAAFANPQNRELPREQRAEMVRVEFEALRAETQKELEAFLPAPDAKKVAEETLGGGRGRMEFMGAGGDSPFAGGGRQRGGG
ncbi:MAG: hypothetical protein ACT4PV_15010 [Planctomycetaceae bacterium]